MTLASNRDLYDYMTALSLDLKLRGAVGLSEAVGVASRYASGSSTEFLGESRIALQRVFSDALTQLDGAFRPR